MKLHVLYSTLHVYNSLVMHIKMSRLQNTAHPFKTSHAHPEGGRGLSHAGAGPGAGRGGACILKDGSEDGQGWAGLGCGRRRGGYRVRPRCKSSSHDLTPRLGQRQQRSSKLDSAPFPPRRTYNFSFFSYFTFIVWTCAHSQPHESTPLCPSTMSLKNKMDSGRWGGKKLLSVKEGRKEGRLGNK